MGVSGCMGGCGEVAGGLIRNLETLTHVSKLVRTHTHGPEAATRHRWVTMRASGGGWVGV